MYPTLNLYVYTSDQVTTDIDQCTFFGKCIFRVPTVTDVQGLSQYISSLVQTSLTRYAAPISTVVTTNERPVLRSDVINALSAFIIGFDDLFGLISYNAGGSRIPSIDVLRGQVVSSYVLSNTTSDPATIIITHGPDDEYYAVTKHTSSTSYGIYRKSDKTMWIQTTVPLRASQFNTSLNNIQLYIPVKDADNNVYSLGFQIYGSTGDYRAAIMISTFGTTPINSVAADWYLTGMYTSPYEPVAGDSEPGGGDGEGEDESDENPPTDPPTVSFTDSGFCRIYNPDKAEIQALSRYMWTDTTFWNTVVNHIKQLLENPIDSIISLCLVPCAVASGTPEEVNVMYIPTGVYMPPVTNQFTTVDCGTVEIKKEVGCALDYNPYTKVHVYLPFIGQVDLNTDEVMGKTLHLEYVIDVVTGVCCARITVNGDIMYNFSGNCAVNQPLSSADFSSYVSAMFTAAKTVTAIAAGGAGAPEIAAGISGVPGPRSKTIKSSELETVRNPATGRQITAGTSKSEKIESTDGPSFGELAARQASNTAAQVINSKFNVEHANGISGNSGYLAHRGPFVIIERPRMCNPREYAKYNGFPSMLYLNLGDCRGYTEVQQIQLTGFTATNPELSEISQLLKMGVIL